jgi:hypothetical protein
VRESAGKHEDTDADINTHTHTHTHTHTQREREVLVFNGDRVDSCTELERSLLEHDTVLVVHAGALREDLRRAGERTAQQRSVGDRESD